MYPNITYAPSPNHSSRNGQPISMLVLHATVGSFASSLAWLRNPQPNNPDDRVSSHYLIRKDGYTVQLVADDRAAWHAGSSYWRSRNSAAIAAQSLSIELENLNTGADPYPAAQLDSCRELCRSLIARYKIARVDLVRHRDIATPLGRKSDPAGFPFAAFAAECYPIVPVPLPPPAYNPARYRVRLIRISTTPNGGPPYAGELAPGAYVEIDATYTTGGGMAHLVDERGFVRLADIEPAGRL